MFCFLSMQVYKDYGLRSSKIPWLVITERELFRSRAVTIKHGRSSTVWAGQCLLNTKQLSLSTYGNRL